MVTVIGPWNVHFSVIIYVVCTGQLWDVGMEGGNMMSTILYYIIYTTNSTKTLTTRNILFLTWNFHTFLEFEIFSFNLFYISYTYSIPVSSDKIFAFKESKYLQTLNMWMISYRSYTNFLLYYERFPVESSTYKTDIPKL